MKIVVVLVEHFLFDLNLWTILFTLCPFVTKRGSIFLL